MKHYTIVCGENIMKTNLFEKLDTPENGRIPAGLTYIGQMIAHDIRPSKNAQVPAGLIYIDQMIAHDIRPSKNAQDTHDGVTRPLLILDSVFDDCQITPEVIDSADKS
mgnify:CR=1 FL=1